MEQVSQTEEPLITGKKNSFQRSLLKSSESPSAIITASRSLHDFKLSECEITSVWNSDKDEERDKIISFVWVVVEILWCFFKTPVVTATVAVHSQFI